MEQVLKATRRLEYLYQTLDGVFVYFSCAEDDPSDESPKLFVGIKLSEDLMHEVPIICVKRIGDGGNMYVHTPEGTLFVPSPLVRQRCGFPGASWSEQGLNKLDLKDFDIVEAPDGQITINGHQK